MTEILDKAIETYRRQRFLAGLNADFAALRRNKAACKEELAERAHWDSTLANGMEDGRQMARRGPARGEIWTCDLDPPRGHEQGGTRPVLIVSVDAFNQGPSGLVIAVPISTKDKKVRSQVAVELSCFSWKWRNAMPE
jgi:hypothetical protein